MEHRKNTAELRTSVVGLRKSGCTEQWERCKKPLENCRKVLLEFDRIEERMESKQEPVGSKALVESKLEPVENMPVESRLVDCMLGLESCIPVPVVNIREQGGCIPVLEESIRELGGCIQEQEDCSKVHRILGVLLGHRKTELPDALHIGALGIRPVEHRKKEVKHIAVRNNVGSHRECESGRHRVRARVHDRDCGHDARVHPL